jgi:hypothetical protein
MARLTPAQLAMLDTLSAPIAADRRPEFLGAVSARLDAAGPAAIGEGSVHRAARSVIADFWTAPPDLRQGRVGPRGPRGELHWTRTESEPACAACAIHVTRTNPHRL